MTFFFICMPSRFESMPGKRVFIFNLWLLQIGEDDPPGFMDKNHEFVSMGQQLESLKKLSEENCTLRIMNEQYQVHHLFLHLF